MTAPRKAARVAMPDGVRIGPLFYTFQLSAERIKEATEDADLGPNGEWLAFSDHQRLVIGINPDHAEGSQRFSVMHEILHCCLRVSGAWPNTYARIVENAHGEHENIPVEEFTVEAQASPLLGVLRDNPELVAWLTQ